MLSSDILNFTQILTILPILIREKILTVKALEITIPITHRELEQQGTKQKFWFQDKLFKIGQTEGENWAEVVAYQLTQLLNLPAAEYGFATFRLELDEKTD